MRTTASVVAILTLLGLFANLTPNEVWGQDSMGILEPAARTGSDSVIGSIVNESEIVIDDSVYRIAPDASFYASDNRTLISFRQFKAGDEVDFMQNADGEIVKLVRMTGR